MNYGLVLDDEQRHFRDAIWDSRKKIVLCDSAAGTGKTTIAVATACLLYHYHLYDGCYYIVTNYSERLGYLPGDLTSKEQPYMTPLYDALAKIREEDCVVRPGTDGPKEGFIYASTDAYVLGVNWDHKVVIIDEAQCLTKSALKALLTRCSDTCKVVVIGSTLQVQGISKEASGFADCIKHFAEKDWAAVCHLTRNYRGEVSAWADKM